MRNTYNKFKYWLKDTGFYRHFLSAVLHPKTFIFLKRYPFWAPYNVWTDRFCGYDHTLYDWIPNGWKSVFGPSLTLDIVEALERDNIPKRKWHEALKFQDIKEKYGTLRLYATTTKKVQQVLDKYECLSRGYCIECGKPARYVTSGYISYLCEDCYRKTADKYGEHGDRLTLDDIPHYYHYDGDTKNETEYTPLERWGIDFAKIWGIEE